MNYLTTLFGFDVGHFHPLLICILILILYYACSSALVWYRLRAFKGPFLASFSWLWLAKTDASGQAWKIHMHVREAYNSSLIRIGPDLLITDNPEIIRAMSSVRSRFTRGDWYNAMRVDVKNPSMFGSRDTAWHDDIKARTSFGYSGKEVPGLERGIDDQVVNLKGLVRRKYLSTAGKTVPVDLARILQFFALDVVGAVGFGHEFGNLKADADVTGYLTAFRAVVPIITLCADIPWLRRLFLNDWMMGAMAPKDTDREGFGRIIRVAKESVDRRLAASGEGNEDIYQDMLSSFLRHGLTRHQCEAEATLQLGAGSDTTTNVLRAAMLYLTSSPAVYRRLQTEIDDAVKQGIVSSPIRHAEAKELPYLRAVIYETLRIHPPNILLACKEVPPEGVTLDGMFIPGGTDIAQNSWSMGRNKELYGEDVDVFRPERWLREGDDEKREEMERVTDLMFGYGRWMCPGKQIAFCELNKVIFELLRDFDFQIINPKKPWSESQFSIFLIKDMWMRVVDRQYPIS